MKYKVGDRVKIIDDLEVYKYYDGIKTNPYMVGCKGKIATITQVNCHTYNIDIDNGDWNWSDGMFEEVSDFEVGDKVRVIKNLNGHLKPYEIGMICEIDLVDSNDLIHTYRIRFEKDTTFWVSKKEIELVCQESEKLNYLIKKLQEEVKEKDSEITFLKGKVSAYEKIFEKAGAVR